MLMCSVFTPDSILKSPLKTQNQLDKPVCYTLFSLAMLMKLYLYRNMPFFKIHVNRFMAQDDQSYLKMHLVGEGPGAIL